MEQNVGSTQRHAGTSGSFGMLSDKLGFPRVYEHVTPLDAMPALACIVSQNLPKIRVK